MPDRDDLLAKFRHPGSAAPAKNSVRSPSGIKLREYNAFVTESSRSSLLLLKRGLVRKPEAELGVPYGYMTKVLSDGYGFAFTLTFSLPFPSGAIVVDVRGEGLTPLIEGILRGTVSSVQLFDPERFLPPTEGTFDEEADEWRGSAVVKEITVTDKSSPDESNTKH